MSFNSSSLSELTSYVNRGITPKYTEYGECYVINQKCIRDNFVDFSLVRKNDITKRKVTPDKTIQIQDILVNSTGVGTLGRVAQVKNTKGILTCDSHVTIVRPNKEKIFPVYLGYYLYGKQNEIELMAQGSTGQTELSRHRLGDLEIQYPSINEQKIIASILSSLDDKIELNNKINQNLEKLAQTLYKHWFVDFEFPNENGEPYKSSGGQMVDSELGLIPKGWNAMNFDKIFDISYGKSKFSTLDKTKKGLYNVYGAGGILSKSPDFDYEYSKVIIGCRGTCGNVTITNPKSKISHNSLVVDYKQVNFSNLFRYLSLKSTNLDSSITGSTQPQITIKNLTNNKIILPKEELVRKFDNITSKFYEKNLSLEKQNQTLTILRDTLLPKLMNGEIEVPV